MNTATCLALVFLAFSLQTARAETSSKATVEVLAHGEKVYLANCVACHGSKGDGRGPASVAITGVKPCDFTVGKFKKGASADELFKTITKGVEGTAMPSWSGLEEADRKAVVQYILSLKKK